MGISLFPGEIVKDRASGALFVVINSVDPEDATVECAELLTNEDESCIAIDGEEDSPRYLRYEPIHRLPLHAADPISHRVPVKAVELLLRTRMAGEVRRFQKAIHPHRPFVPGVSSIPMSGKVVGTTEIQYLVESALDGWFTTGRFNTEFERSLSRFIGVRHVLTTNSGSSANLLAISALTSPLLGDKALKPGDEVLTVAAGFPTTVNPILQNNLVPVFVDVEIPTYNVDVSQLEAAVTPRTRAIILAHTLGNPFNLAAVTKIARQHDLWLVEDCCDALGTTYQDRTVGTFGDIGTLSFYPAHHITMGEGGAVFTRHGTLKRALESIRDWGRDCWCAPGKDDTCGKRFLWKLGALPEGYDHKYTYSHLGYNLKISDMQAAIGLAQLQKVTEFIAARKANFRQLYQRLASLTEYLILPAPTPESDPSWFGFPITLREGGPMDREALLHRLHQHRIGTRLLFAGNLTKQPYFQGRQYRVHSDLRNTDTIMKQTFWIGVYPGLTPEMIDYVGDAFNSVFQETTPVTAVPEIVP